MQKIKSNIQTLVVDLEAAMKVKKKVGLEEHTLYLPGSSLRDFVDDVLTGYDNHPAAYKESFYTLVDFDKTVKNSKQNNTQAQKLMLKSLHDTINNKIQSWTPEQKFPTKEELGRLFNKLADIRLQIQNDQDRKDFLEALQPSEIHELLSEEQRDDIVKEINEIKAAQLNAEKFKNTQKIGLVTQNEFCDDTYKAKFPGTEVRVKAPGDAPAGKGAGGQEVQDPNAQRLQPRNAPEGQTQGVQEVAEDPVQVKANVHTKNNNFLQGQQQVSQGTSPEGKESTTKSNEQKPPKKSESEGVSYVKTGLWGAAVGGGVAIASAFLQIPYLTTAFNVAVTMTGPAVGPIVACIAFAAVATICTVIIAFATAAIKNKISDGRDVPNARPPL